MRDQLLAAVTARLERVAAAQDPALVLEAGALEDAQRLAVILHGDDGDIEAHYQLGWFYWYQFLALLPEGQDHGALNAASRAFTPCFIAGVEGLPAPLLPFLAEKAVNTASGLLAQMMSGSSDVSLITATVSLWQRVVPATPADHPDRAAMLSHLSGALRVRFERVGALADLDEAVAVGREQVQITPAEHPNRAECLSDLGAALWARIKRLGALADLDEAVAILREAVQATPADHPKQFWYLSNLGNLLRLRFEHAGALADLDEAVTIVREAAQATPADHPDRAAMVSHLAGALRVRFERVGALADLDERSRSRGRRRRPPRPTTPTGPCAATTWAPLCGAGSSGWGHWLIWTRPSRSCGRRRRPLRPITPTGRADCPN